MNKADSTSDRGSSSTWSVGAAAAAAVAASACCAIPLVLVSLGVGGVWIGSLTALAPYRWVFVAVALASLAYAGYHEWDLHRRPECECETIFSSRSRRVLLGVAGLAVIALVISPWLVAPSPSAATERALGMAGTEAADPGTKPPSSFQQVVLDVEGMTCAACPATVKTALEDVDGVYRVEATYEPPEAVVRFDPETTSIEALTQATADVGFPSSPRIDS